MSNEKRYYGQFLLTKGKKDIKKDFYRIRTETKTYFCNSLEDITGTLSEDEGGFEVAHIEYIGNFKGKDDVISISSANGKEYVTFVTADMVTYYVPYYNTWKCQNNTSYEKYYDILKNYGVILMNDVYTRENNFRKEVNRQLDN